MKLRILAVLSVLVFAVFSCKSKKTGTSGTGNKYMPGDTQLKEIQAKFPEATAQTLKEGYDVYVGPCTDCHGKKNMYKGTEADWQKSINKMAPKAKITDAQKDALWKYVLSMRLAKEAAAK